MKYVLKNANVIPMNKEVVLDHMDVVIDSGIITEISKDIQHNDAMVIDCTDKYVIPGLYDMHVHLNNSDMNELLLANGVVGVRNMWGFPNHFKWKDEINSYKRIGPHIFSTGPLTDGVTYWEGSNIVTTVEQAEKSVKKDVQDGFDFIKTYPSIPKDAFLKMMETANALNIKVVGHGNEFLTTEELIKSGYYCIEHSNCLPKDHDEIRAIARSGMWFCPTQAVVRTIYDYVVMDKKISDLEHYEYINKMSRDMWEEITIWRKEKPKDPKRRFDLNEINERARVFVEGSNNIILGTDTDNPGVIPGFSIHNELWWMTTDLGLTPYQALRTGTVHAARHLNKEDQFGSIEVGKWGDVLILEKNPLEDIRNSKSILGIVKLGKYYDREFLDEVLNSVKNRKPEEIEVVYDAL
jgi:imidazolonepropionase-like amidohydrolase